MTVLELIAWSGWAIILACIIVGMVRNHLEQSWERRDAKRRRR